MCLLESQVKLESIGSVQCLLNSGSELDAFLVSVLCNIFNETLQILICMAMSVPMPCRRLLQLAVKHIDSHHKGKVLNRKMLKPNS